MSNDEKLIPPPSEWEATHLRLTAFPGVSLNMPFETWVEELTGQPPDLVTRQRSGHAEVVSSFNSWKLTLNIEPVKVEWRLSPSGNDLTDEDNIATLGPFLQVADNFSQLMSKWLSNCSSEFNRIAFGSELIMSVESQMIGYQQLMPYLRDVKIDPVKSFDFLYQINRPRKSTLGISNLFINRLSKWSVGKYARIAILPSGQIVQLSEIERYFSRLELDINTSQNFANILPSGKLANIFQELIDLGSEISIKGDVP